MALCSQCTRLCMLVARVSGCVVCTPRPGAASVRPPPRLPGDSGRPPADLQPCEGGSAIHGPVRERDTRPCEGARNTALLENAGHAPAPCVPSSATTVRCMMCDMFVGLAVCVCCGGGACVCTKVARLTTRWGGEGHARSKVMQGRVFTIQQ